MDAMEPLGVVNAECPSNYDQGPACEEDCSKAMNDFVTNFGCCAKYFSRHAASDWAKDKCELDINPCP